ncbi:MAG: hypothetical protein VW450_07920 [Chloroflexota bacterium]
MAHGITVKEAAGGSRVEIRAQNQAGVLYATPAEASWVAAPEQLAAHALAGFLNDLTQDASPAVHALMAKWGIAYRPLPLEEA